MNLLVWSIIISFYNMVSIKFIPKVNYELILELRINQLGSIYLTIKDNIVVVLNSSLYTLYFFFVQFVLWLMNMNKEHKKLVNEISVLKNEQSQISIVKEFAKHTKLQRRINKLNEELKTHSMS